LLRKTFDIRTIFNIRKTFDLRRTLNLREALNIRKILLPLDGHSGAHRVSRMARGLVQAGGPILDAEEVTVSPSTNIKA